METRRILAYSLILAALWVLLSYALYAYGLTNCDGLGCLGLDFMAGTVSLLAILVAQITLMKLQGAHWKLFAAILVTLTIALGIAQFGFNDWLVDTQPVDSLTDYLSAIYYSAFVIPFITSSLLSNFITKRIARD